MDPDLSQLDVTLDELDVDGYLIDADSTDADQYYLSGFDAPDPFLTLYDGSIRLLFARSLEFGRAKRESRAETVERFTDYGYDDYLEEHDRTGAAHQSRAAFLKEHDIGSVAVPSRFPLSTADGLREQGVEVLVDDDETVTEIRAAKTDEEIDHVRAAQRANEAAMEAAEDLLARAEIDGDRLLVDGEPLTSERVKETIEVTLLRHGCALDETIVACGQDAADPHDRGSGPLKPDESIIVDIFPQDK
ncbi:MAG: aminopeptidase P family N-terminal domain-containing protein, partial [Halapricum sp.]